MSIKNRDKIALSHIRGPVETCHFPCVLYGQHVSTYCNVIFRPRYTKYRSFVYCVLGSHIPVLCFGTECGLGGAFCLPTYEWQQEKGYLFMIQLKAD